MKRQSFISLWRELNARNFGGVLTLPRIFASRTRFAYAIYSADDGEHGFIFYARTLKFSDARETVYHEMIHQYMNEYLHSNRWYKHGREFRKQYTKFLTDDITPDIGLTI